MLIQVLSSRFERELIDHADVHVISRLPPKSEPEHKQVTPASVSGAEASDVEIIFTERKTIGIAQPVRAVQLDERPKRLCHFVVQVQTPEQAVVRIVMVGRNATGDVTEEVPLPPTLRYGDEGAEFLTVTALPRVGRTVVPFPSASRR